MKPNHKAVEMTPDQKAEAVFYEIFGGKDLSLAQRGIQRRRQLQRKKTSSLQKQFCSEFAAFIRFQIDHRLKSAGE